MQIIRCCLSRFLLKKRGSNLCFWQRKKTWHLRKYTTALKSQLVSAGLFFFNDDDKQCGLHFSCRSHALLKAESFSDCWVLKEEEAAEACHSLQLITRQTPQSSTHIIYLHLITCEHLSAAPTLELSNCRWIHVWPRRHRDTRVTRNLTHKRLDKRSERPPPMEKSRRSSTCLE